LAANAGFRHSELVFSPTRLRLHGTTYDDDEIVRQRMCDPILGKLLSGAGPQGWMIRYGQRARPAGGAWEFAFFDFEEDDAAVPSLRLQH